VKRLLVGIVVLALLAVGVTAAIGQGTGGTVGSAATGVKHFDITFKHFGANCGQKPQRKCYKKLSIADVTAGNAILTEGGKKAGTVVFSDIVAKPIKSGSVDTFTATIVWNNGVDTLSVVGASRDSGKPVPYAIVGGTGIYAGARGTARDTKPTPTGLTVEATFIP
jgi:hypothetical protein